MKQVLLVVLVLGALAVVACGAQQQPTATPTPSTFESPLGLPNPASKFCEDQGYRLEMRTDANGGTAGFCIFPDGTECDEWAFFRGECGPATPAP